MEEMPSINTPVQRLKVAILPLGLPCSGPVTHSGEILTTGKSHGKKPTCSRANFNILQIIYTCITWHKNCFFTDFEFGIAATSLLLSCALPPLTLIVRTSAVSTAVVYKYWCCNQIVRLRSLYCTCFHSEPETIQVHATVPLQKLRTIQIVIKVFIALFRNPFLQFYPEPLETTPPSYTFFL